MPVNDNTTPGTAGAGTASLPAGAKAELLREWRAILACFVGLIFAAGTIVTYTAGVVSVPMVAEFGWSRSDFAIVISFFYYAVVIGSLVCGYLTDRFGPRRPIIFSTAAMALGLAAISQLPGVVWMWSVGYGAIGLLAMGTLPIAYARVISTRLDKARGTALGIALTGVGIGSAILPAICQALIDNFGWRAAFLGLAVGTGVVALTILTAFIPDDRPSGEAKRAGIATLKSGYAHDPRSFIGLGLISLLSGAVLTGLVVNVVPLGAAREYPSAMLATMGLTLGLSIIAGRLGIGIMMDHFNAARVLALFLIGPVIGALMLTAPDLGVPMILLAVALIGLAQGAEIDAVAFLTSRYFSREHFGMIYGAMFALFTIGAANGPLLFARLQGEDPVATTSLTTYSIVILIAAVISLIMRDPRRATQERAPS